MLGDFEENSKPQLTSNQFSATGGPDASRCRPILQVTIKVWSSLMGTYNIRPVVAQHQLALHWLSKLDRFASPGSQKKGWDYLFSGAVNLTLASPDHVKGLIAGSSKSKVDISVQGHSIV